MSYYGNNALELSTRAMFAGNRADFEEPDDFFADPIDEVAAQLVESGVTFANAPFSPTGLRDLPIGGSGSHLGFGRLTGHRKVTVIDDNVFLLGLRLGVGSSWAVGARAAVIGSAYPNTESELPVAARGLKAPASVVDQIVRELGRLTDGWAWPEAKAPSESVLKDVQTAAVALPHTLRKPEVEVDPDDGAVVLRWLGENGQTFSLTFVGNGFVTGFLSSDNDKLPAWSNRVDDAIRLLLKISDDRVVAVISE
jgi:hypothetical protein